MNNKTETIDSCNTILKLSEEYVFLVDTEAAFDLNPTYFIDFWFSLTGLFGREIRSRPDTNRKEVMIFFLDSPQELKTIKDYFYHYIH